MMMTRITVQPDAEPITLDEAKAHCRIENALDNLYLSSLIMTARQSAEQYTRMSFLPQTRLMTLNQWQQINHLPWGPTSAIVSIQYLDSNALEQTLNPSLYKLHRSDDFDFFTVAPGKRLPDMGGFENGIAVEYQCGFADAASVPKAIKQAMLLHIGDLYENRERNILTLRFENTHAYENLLNPYVRLLF